MRVTFQWKRYFTKNNHKHDKWIKRKWKLSKSSGRNDRKKGCDDSRVGCIACELKDRAECKNLRKLQAAEWNWYDQIATRKYSQTVRR